MTPSRINLNLYVGGYYLNLTWNMMTRTAIMMMCPLNAQSRSDSDSEPTVGLVTRDDGPGGDASRRGRRWGPSVRSDCHQLDIKFNLTRLS